MFSFPLTDTVHIIVDKYETVIIAAATPITSPTLFRCLNVKKGKPVFLIILVFTPERLTASLIFL